MFTLIVTAFVIFIAYKVFFAGPKGETPEVSEVGAIKDAVNTFKTELGPVKENVVNATNKARESYDQAQKRATINKLLKDENLVNLLVAAKMAEQLENQEKEEQVEA